MEVRLCVPSSREFSLASSNDSRIGNGSKEHHAGMEDNKLVSNIPPRSIQITYPTESVELMIAVVPITSSWVVISSSQLKSSSPLPKAKESTVSEIVVKAVTGVGETTSRNVLAANP